MRRTVPAIFIDTNVPIYSGGGPHPLRQPCTEILSFIGDRAQDFVTSAEVLQELLHVYLSRRLWPAGRVVFNGFLELMSGRVESVLASDAEDAADLADQYSDLDARDLIHLAVMNRLGVTRIISTDTGFDRVAAIERLDPRRFSEWRDRIPDLP